MSLKIDEIVEVLKSSAISSTVLTKVVEELKSKEEEKKEAREDNAPKSKKQYVLLSPNPASGHAVQIKEGQDASKVVDLICTVINNYNTNSRKGKKNPVKTVSEAIQTIPNKFFVEAGVWVKTKELVPLYHELESSYSGPKGV